MSSLLAGRDQERNSDPGKFVARQRLPRAADAGGQRPQIRARLLGERTESVAPRIGHVGARGRFERRSDHLRGQARAIHEPDADAAEDRCAHPLRVLDRKDGRDPAPQRVAHDVGAIDTEMIEQRPHVARHEAAVISGGIVQLARLRRDRDCRAR